MMAQLNPKPSSSTKRQHQALVIAGRRRSLDLAEIRKLVGGSITRLSAAEASDWIEHFTGRGLPNPPGQKPNTYKAKRATPGTVRMITKDHIDQIVRLGVAYFGEAHLLIAWLVKNFREIDAVDARGQRGHRAVVRLLGTTKRAGEVIRVLKEMTTRGSKGASDQNHATTRETS